jgi:hypothetical protein
MLGAAAAVLCVAASRIHPVAWPLILEAPFVVFVASDPWQTRVRNFVIALVAIGAAVFATSAGIVAERIGTVTRVHSGWTIAAPLSVVPILALWFFVARPRRIVIAAAVPVIGFLLTSYAYSNSAFQEASYGRVFVALPMLALVAVARVESRRTQVLVGAAALSLLIVASPGVRRQTTEQLEYRWLRDHFAGLRAGCPVTLVMRAGRGVRAVPDYAGEGIRAVAVWSADDVRGVRKSSGCAYYARTSLCTTSDGRGACDAIERELELTPIAEATFPAAVSYDPLPYDQQSVYDRIASVSNNP